MARRRMVLFCILVVAVRDVEIVVLLETATRLMMINPYQNFPILIRVKSSCHTLSNNLVAGRDQWYTYVRNAHWRVVATASYEFPYCWLAASFWLSR